MKIHYIAWLTVIVSITNYIMACSLGTDVPPQSVIIVNESEQPYSLIIQPSEEEDVWNTIIDPFNSVNLGNYENFNNVTVKTYSEQNVAGKHVVQMPKIITKKVLSKANNGNYYIYIEHKDSEPGWDASIRDIAPQRRQKRQTLRCNNPVAVIQETYGKLYTDADMWNAFPGIKRNEYMHHGQRSLPSHVLNIDRYTATPVMIDNLYSRLKQQWDPANYPDRQWLVEEIMNTINVAYGVISAELKLVKEHKNLDEIADQLNIKDLVKKQRQRSFSVSQRQAGEQRVAKSMLGAAKKGMGAPRQQKLRVGKGDDHHPDIEPIGDETGSQIYDQLLYSFTVKNKTPYEVIDVSLEPQNEPYRTAYFKKSLVREPIEDGAIGEVKSIVGDIKYILQLRLPGVKRVYSWPLKNINEQSEFVVSWDEKKKRATINQELDYGDEIPIAVQRKQPVLPVSPKKPATRKEAQQPQVVSVSVADHDTSQKAKPDNRKAANKKAKAEKKEQKAVSVAPDKKKQESHTETKPSISVPVTVKPLVQPDTQKISSVVMAEPQQETPKQPTSPALPPMEVTVQKPVQIPVTQPIRTVQPAQQEKTSAPVVAEKNVQKKREPEHPEHMEHVEHMEHLGHPAQMPKPKPRTEETVQQEVHTNVAKKSA